MGTIRMLAKPFLTSAILCLSSYHVAAQDSGETTGFTPSGQVWGYVFGDYFYKAGGDTALWGRAHYAGTQKDMQGAQLRRLYFGYDYHISPSFTSRLLFEANNSFLVNGTYAPFVKLGYLEWKDPIPFLHNASINIGLIPTPVFAFPERTWGYRSVEKEALDARGLGRSADQGVSLTGTFDGAGNYGYTMMVGSGAGTRQVADRFLEYYTSIYARLFNRRVSFEGMANYKNDGDGRSRFVARGFAAYNGPGFTLGAEVAETFNSAALQHNGTDRTVRPFVVSLFASAGLPFITDDLRAFARYDMYDPDLGYERDLVYSDRSQYFSEHMIIAGLHFQPTANVNVMPNIWINRYDDKRNGEAHVGRASDVVLRMTLYYVFR